MEGPLARDQIPFAPPLHLFRLSRLYLPHRNVKDSECGSQMRIGVCKYCRRRLRSCVSALKTARKFVVSNGISFRKTARNADDDGVFL